MVAQTLERLLSHLLPQGVVAAPFMTLWRTGDPPETERETSAVRPDDGAVFRRVARSRYDAETECEYSENLYQVVVNGQVVAEEVHRRSPAARSYTPHQALAAFARAGFGPIELYRGFTFEPAKRGDRLFTLVGHAAMDR